MISSSAPCPIKKAQVLWASLLKPGALFLQATLLKPDGYSRTTAAVSLHFRISEVLRRVLQLVMGLVTALKESAEVVAQAAYFAQCQHSALQRSIDEASWHDRNGWRPGPQQVGAIRTCWLPPALAQSLHSAFHRSIDEVA